MAKAKEKMKWHGIKYMGAGMGVSWPVAEK